MAAFTFKILFIYVSACLSIYPPLAFHLKQDPLTMFWRAILEHGVTRMSKVNL